MKQLWGKKVEKSLTQPSLQPSLICKIYESYNGIETASPKVSSIIKVLFVKAESI
jgi:hypothetical protein